MKKINFLLGIHNHQPVGNFRGVFDDAYKKSYLPFMQLMSKHPHIKWTLHCTGVLWDYFSAHHPEYLDMVRKMVTSGQLEILTGGYYEPIMPAIPDEDKKGQIQKLSDFIRKEFKCEPKGMWLAERVWEPHLAKVLNEAGVKYTIVDDTHFAAAGHNIDKLRGYYITEEQGVKLSIFPISQQLRYYIPFKTIEKNLEYFGSIAAEGGMPAVVMADDGEKFGLWPETYKHVYEDKWLDNFLTMLDKNSEWINTMTFSEYLNAAPPEGRVYLPTASYFEMSEWSLPAQTQEIFIDLIKRFHDDTGVKSFLRGGFWRNFLSKYSESNNMHKKMLHLSSKIRAAETDEHAKKLKSKSPKRPHESLEVSGARNALFAGQCNCAYWHGVFGGLYLPHLRNAIYHQLIEAESILNEETKKKPSWTQSDFDCDNRDEVLYEGGSQNLYFSPHEGGSLFEWDLVPFRVNMQNVLTRRKEAYHKKLREFIATKHGANQKPESIHDLVRVKEAHLDEYLNYDWYRRVSLIDHFFHPGAKYEEFKKCQYGEQGDFVTGNYEASIDDEGITLSRKGNVWVNEHSIEIALSKKVIPQDSGIKIAYSVKNLSGREVTLRFAPEFNLAFSYGTDQDSNELAGISEWARNDKGFGFDLKMKFDVKAGLWVFPIETVSLSEYGFERTYQGTSVTPVFEFKLARNEAKATEIVIKIEKVK